MVCQLVVLIKEAHFICLLCETGSVVGSYLKDLHPSGQCCVRRHKCSFFSLTSPLLKLPGCLGICLCIDIIGVRGDRGGSWQVGCYLFVKSLLEAWIPPVTWSTSRALCASINLSSGSSGVFGVSSAMIHVGQLRVRICMCLCSRASSDWW